MYTIFNCNSTDWTQQHNKEPANKIVSDGYQSICFRNGILIMMILNNLETEWAADEEKSLTFSKHTKELSSFYKVKCWILIQKINVQLTRLNATYTVSTLGIMFNSKSLESGVLYIYVCMWM